MQRRIVLAGLPLAASAALTPAQAQTTDEAHRLAERFAATLTAHDLAAFADLFAEDYQNHQTSAAAPAVSGKTQKQGSVDFFAARLAAMPDLTVEIEAMVAEPGKVAASFVYRGTHRGPYFGIAPTGRALRFTSCDIFVLRNGRLAEH